MLNFLPSYGCMSACMCALVRGHTHGSVACLTLVSLAIRSTSRGAPAFWNVSLRLAVATLAVFLIVLEVFLGLLVNVG